MKVYDHIIDLESLQVLGGQLVIIAVVFFTLVLGGIIMLLLASDLVRARGHEIKNLRKFGHEPSEKKGFTREFRERVKGQRNNE